MLGHKDRDFKQHVAVSLETLVPQDNFYRQVDQCIDLSFVRDLAEEFYSKFGRPSIDPVVFFRLQLIAFFEGIRSERQLMNTVNLNLAHRWFIVPVSHLTKWQSPFDGTRSRPRVHPISAVRRKLIDYHTFCSISSVDWMSRARIDSEAIPAALAASSTPPTTGGTVSRTNLACGATFRIVSWTASV